LAAIRNKNNLSPSLFYRLFYSLFSYNMARPLPERSVGLNYAFGKNCCIGSSKK